MYFLQLLANLCLANRRCDVFGKTANQLPTIWIRSPLFFRELRVLRLPVLKFVCREVALIHQMPHYTCLMNLMLMRIRTVSRKVVINYTLHSAHCSYALLPRKRYIKQLTTNRLTCCSCVFIEVIELPQSGLDANPCKGTHMFHKRLKEVKINAEH